MAGPEVAESQGHRTSRYRNLQGNHSVSIFPSAARKVVAEKNSNDGQVQRRISSAPSAATGNSIARSMSRYRRHANTVSAERDAAKNGNVAPKITAPHPSEDPLPPVPALPSKLRSSLQGRSGHISQKEGELVAAASHHSPPQPQLRHVQRATRHLNRKMAEHQSQSSTSSDEIQRQKVADHDDVDRRLKEEEQAAIYAAEVARLEAETDRILAEQKKKDLERLQAQLAANQEITLRSHKPPRSPIIEKFSSFTKRSKSRDGLSPGLSPTSSIAGSVVDFNSSRTNLPLPEMPKLPPGIEQGGKGIVPQTDAPISAVNAGDRIVSIRYKQHTFVLPVTPHTTPVDIIFSTAKQLTYDLEIGPATCIVIENYNTLGLERRLRKFEHIRDVMNSWDRDTHNQLVVALSEFPDSDRDLEIESVPKSEEPPRGIQAYVYHSNKPGKWNKRYVTLLDNGQLICAKKPNASSADKETLSLCHLSDYDIYTPVESQMRKVVKPPKKHCFAIKSQSKPSMFMNTENFVQYFCSDDQRVAFQFHEAVHAWRSWYLVDRRPEARRVSIPKIDEKPPQLMPAIKHAPKKSFNVASMNGHRLKISVDEAPYTVGEFEPLLDMSRFDKRLSQFGKDFLPTVPDPSTMPKLKSFAAKNDSKDDKPNGPLVDKIKSTSDEAFTGNGLLADDYEKRKAASTEAEKEAIIKRLSKDVEGGNFTEGSLLDAKQEMPPQPESPSWFPSALEHSKKERDHVEALRPSTSAGTMNHQKSLNNYPNPFQHGRAPSITRRPLPQTPDNRLRANGPGQGPRRPAPPGPPGPPGSSPNSGSSPGMSQQNRRQPPRPLVNLTPTLNEPPQHQKKGHGVVVPEGMKHLVDMISVGGNPKPSGLLEVPPRSAMRRPGPPNTAPLPNAPPHQSVHRPNGLVRTRSKSSGAPPSRPLAIGDFPPVPPLPGRHRAREASMPRMPPPRMSPSRDGPHHEHRDHRVEPERRGRERMRPMPEYNSVPGRTGTLKVV